MESTLRGVFNDDKIKVDSANVEELDQNMLVDEEEKEDDVSTVIGDDVEREFEEHKKQKFKDEDDRDRNTLRNKYEKIRKINDKAKLPDIDFSRKMSSKEIRYHQESINKSVVNASKVEFMWNVVVLTARLFEYAVDYVGYGLRFSGWHEEVKANKAEYEKHLRAMIEDKIVIDVETGQEIIVKNTTWLATTEFSPYVSLIMALVQSAILYTSANNYDRIARRFTTIDKKMTEDDIINNVRIPDDD